MIGVLDSLWRDVRSALRAIRHSPGFALVVLLSLSFGIGANTAIFSLVNSLMLKSLPVRVPGELVVLEHGSWTNPIWEEIRDHQQALDGVLAWGEKSLDLVEGGESRFVRGVLASGSYFDVLGVSALVGRVFRAEDDRRGCGADGPVAVLSYGFWQSRYGGDPGVLGQPLRLDRQPFTIIGVTPPRFHGLEVGRSFDVAVPLCADAAIRGAESSLDHRSWWWLTIMGRLKPGSTPAQAQASLRSIQDAVREATTPTYWPEELQAKYLDEPFSLAYAASGVSGLRNRYREALLVLMAVSGLVLLVACANIANLMLARAAARSKELAVRVSVGASRAHLIRQLTLESVVLGVLGAVAGAVLAHWASRMLVLQLTTGRTTAFLDMSVDWRMLAFTSGVGILTGLVFGIYPAFRAARRAPSDALRRIVRGTSGIDMRFGVGRWLVAVQVGLSLILLFGAALFTRSYTSLVDLDPGFDTANVLVVRMYVQKPQQGEPEDEKGRRRLYENLLDELRAIPGVSSAAQAHVAPISGSRWNSRIEVDGFSPQSERDDLVHFNYVSPGYFRTLGTPLLAGRDVNEGDTTSSKRVAIVNELLAEKFFGGNAIGKSYRTRVGQVWREVEVIGIVSDAKYAKIREPVPPTAYCPYSQTDRAYSSTSFLIRAAGDLEGLRASIVRAAADLDPNITMTFRTLEAQVDDSLVQERLLATLSALFGVLALILAAVGLAGLVSYSVNRRRSELGIRAALGATPGALVLLVLREVAFVTSVGLVLGAAGGLASGRFVSSLLYGLSAGDLETLTASAAALAIVAVVAGFIPARRAGLIEAMECLRID
jgi:putative ABC transport system permease protein